MNTFPPGGPDDDPFEPIQKPFEKPIEKIKADKEVPEKLKREKEVPEKIKPEKEAKLEKFEKEGKFEKEKREKEKLEKEGKLEIKEGKEFDKQPEKQNIEKQPEKQINEKQFVPEKVVVEKPPEIENLVDTKLIANENPLSLGQEAINPVIPGNLALDLDTLMQHADSLEQSGRALRHFIQRSQRPDLSTGALANEEDRQEEEDA